MRALLATLILWAALLPAAHGQGLIHEYTATCSGSDTAAGKTCTINLPAASARYVRLKSAFIQCSAACTVSQARDGTAPSATAATVRKLNPNATWIIANAASVFSASDVGAGTAVGPSSITIGASPSYLPLDLSGIVLERGAAAAQNYSLTVTLTGTYVVTFLWEERPQL